jgi:hypothetical protein
MWDGGCEALDHAQQREVDEELDAGSGRSLLFLARAPMRETLVPLKTQTADRPNAVSMDPTTIGSLGPRRISERLLP